MQEQNAARDDRDKVTLLRHGPAEEGLALSLGADHWMGYCRDAAKSRAWGMWAAPHPRQVANSGPTASESLGTTGDNAWQN